MAKVIKCKWVGTPAGGGAAIQGFIEYKEELIKLPDGRRVTNRDKAPVMSTVMPSREDDDIISDDPILGERRPLSLGDFYVQDVPHNREILKGFVRKGIVQLDDWDLHYELEGTEAPEQEIDRVIDNGKDVIEHIPPESEAAKKAKRDAMLAATEKAREEKKAEIEAKKSAFDKITCIKVNRSAVLDGLLDKGIETLESLSAIDTDVLITIKGVGIKLANNMKEQASELLE